MIIDAKTLTKLDLGKLEETLLGAIIEQLQEQKEPSDQLKELEEVHDTLQGYVAASYETTAALEALRLKVFRILKRPEAGAEEE